MSFDIAALYVLPRTHYLDIEGVDCWPEKRDARRYPGTAPVVAHPPCGPWSRFWHTLADPTPRPLAPLAVEQVRKWGGVLEHPALSHLWSHCRLPAPLNPRQIPLFDPRDEHGGFAIEVEQGWWGHQSQKRTWLYIVGGDPWSITVPPPKRAPPPPRVEMRFDKRRGKSYPRSASDLNNPTRRKKTTPAFAVWLVDLARSCRP